MSRINKTVVYDTALMECGVRYCPGGVWCNILHCGSVVYDTALGERGVRYCNEGAVVYDTTPRRQIQQRICVFYIKNQIFTIYIVLQQQNKFTKCVATC